MKRYANEESRCLIQSPFDVRNFFSVLTTLLNQLPYLLNHSFECIVYFYDPVVVHHMLLSSEQLTGHVFHVASAVRYA